MKRLIFAIIAFITATAIGISINYLFNKTSLEFSKAAEQYYQTVEEKNIEEYGTMLENIWQKRRAVISLFSPKKIYEEADREIKYMKYAVSVNEFRALCKKTSQLLKEAAESDLPRISNIF